MFDLFLFEIGFKKNKNKKKTKCMTLKIEKVQIANQYIAKRTFHNIISLLKVEVFLRSLIPFTSFFLSDSFLFCRFSIPTATPFRSIF